MLRQLKRKAKPSLFKFFVIIFSQFWPAKLSIYGWYLPIRFEYFGCNFFQACETGLQYQIVSKFPYTILKLLANTQLHVDVTQN